MQLKREKNGADVDWFAGLVNKHGWKAYNVHIGPLFDNLFCVHPDTAQEILKNGRLL